jgi:tetratricopeptide (TPR) repeat protein
MDYMIRAAKAIGAAIPYLVKGEKANAADMEKDLWELVKKPFEIKERDRKLIEKMQKNPGDEGTKGAVTYKLGEYMDEDPELAKEVGELLDKIYATQGSEKLNPADILEARAGLYRDTTQLRRAEVEYLEALKTSRNLAEKNPGDYLPDVAKALNNLGSLHADILAYEQAEKEFDEALTIYRGLAKENPDDFLQAVAGTLNNMAILHASTNAFLQAGQEYSEALNIRMSLAEDDPDTYLPEVAATFFNLANLHGERNAFPEAEMEYSEALKIYRNLAKENPAVHLPRVAKTLNNLAVLHRNRTPLRKRRRNMLKPFRSAGTWQRRIPRFICRMWRQRSTTWPFCTSMPPHMIRPRPNTAKP